MHVFRVGIVRLGFLLQPFHRGIETVELPYLSVAVGDIPDARLSEAASEKLYGHHNLWILLECLKFLSRVHVGSEFNVCTNRYAPAP